MLTSGLALIVVDLYLIDFTIRIPVFDVLTIFNKNDVITWDGEALVLIGGFPVYLYLIIHVIVTLLSKTFEPPNTLAFWGNLIGVVSFVLMGVLWVISIIVSIWLSSSDIYSPCKSDTTVEYYVKDTRLCESYQLRSIKRELF
ncbi:hypothetical protein [Atlantibacter sp.]|uniref:hypothetical protein n=1 Tax=Atlantibacter sp. TaxID=1903473 RepID=UPI0028A62C35|nr:hypothetical protein [Atlantibacter sp.]